jgi:hypothetical protein
MSHSGVAQYLSLLGCCDGETAQWLQKRITSTQGVTYQTN